MSLLRAKISQMNNSVKAHELPSEPMVWLEAEMDRGSHPDPSARLCTEQITQIQSQKKS